MSKYPPHLLPKSTWLLRTPVIWNTIGLSQDGSYFVNDEGFSYSARLGYKEKNILGPTKCVRYNWGSL